MRITIETAAYNAKRYGRPYVGVVDAATGKVDRWGQWIGQPGDAGMLEIDAQPGDVLMHGQKDTRGNHSAPSYGLVQVDGAVVSMTKAEAVKAARAMAAAQAPAPAAAPAPTLDDALQALHNLVAAMAARYPEDLIESDPSMCAARELLAKAGK